MNNVDPAESVASLAVARPQRTRLFEQLGIDYCCGGAASLRDACEQQGLDVDTIVRLLEGEAETPATEGIDWTAVPLERVVDHIESSHHRYLRRELPRLSELMAKVVEAHGQERAELRELAAVLEDLRCDLTVHLEREEHDLFPAVRRGGDLPPRLREQLPELIGEHEETGRLLHELRRLAGGYRLDETACTTHHALVDGLRDLELDVHQHVYEENHVLFPRLVGRLPGERPDCLVPSSEQP